MDIRACVWSCWKLSLDFQLYTPSHQLRVRAVSWVECFSLALFSCTGAGTDPQRCIQPEELDEVPKAGNVCTD